MLAKLFCCYLFAFISFGGLFRYHFRLSVSQSFLTPFDTFTCDKCTILLYTCLPLWKLTSQLFASRQSYAEVIINFVVVFYLLRWPVMMFELATSKSIMPYHTIPCRNKLNTAIQQVIADRPGQFLKKY